MNVVVFCLAISQFIIWRQYGKFINIEGAAEVWTAGEQNTSDLQMIKIVANSKPVCKSSGIFDYWRDASASTTFTNHTCVPICHQSGPSSNCLHLSQAVVKESHTSIVLLTQFQQNNPLRNFFVSSVEGIQLHLAYAFRIPKVPWLYTPQSQKKWESHSSEFDYNTAIMTSTGALWGEVHAGSRLSLSLKQMLNIAGINSLDEVHPLAGRNYLPGASGDRAKGPIRRISGLELHVVFDCSRHQGDSTTSKVRKLVQYPACVLTVEAAPSTWVHLDFAKQGTARGVRVKTITRGTQLAIDFSSIYLNLAACAVFFQLPHAIIFGTALFLCGHLSTIYRSLIYRRFSLTQEAGAMTMRLLEHEVAFNELEAPGHNHEGSGHISKAVIAQSLGHVMERRGSVLDSREMEQMIDFCLTTVVENFNGQEQGLDEGGCKSFLTEACDGLNTFFEDVKESAGFPSQRNLVAGTDIDLDRFASACSSAEPISFDALVKLFDKDRRVGFMESFFMPKKLRDSISKAKQQAGFGDASSHRQGSMTNDLISIKDTISDFNDRLSAHMTERQEMVNTVESLTLQAEDFSKRIKEHQDKVDQEQIAVSERIQQLAAQFADVQQQLTNSGDERKEVEDKASMSSFLRGTAATLRLANQVQTLQSELKDLGCNMEEQQARHKLEQLAVQEEVEKLNMQVSKLQLHAKAQHPIFRDGTDTTTSSANTTWRPIGEDTSELEAAAVTVPWEGGPQHKEAEPLSSERSTSKQNAGLVSLRESADSSAEPVCSSEHIMADLRIRAYAINDFIETRMKEFQTELKVQVQMHLEAIRSEFKSLPRPMTVSVQTV